MAHLDTWGAGLAALRLRLGLNTFLGIWDGRSRGFARCGLAALRLRLFGETELATAWLRFGLPLARGACLGALRNGLWGLINGAMKNRAKAKKIAVVLSGCGNKDGSEITEVVSLIVALSQAGVEISYFAPNLEFTPKNFVTGQPMAEKRNVLVESARICRGQIEDLKNLRAGDFDGLAFPGGFGAALHLSNWAEKGADCEVNSSVEKSILDFFGQHKPIAAICIAPVILAKVLGSKGISLTIGNDEATAAEIRKTGAQHKACAVNDCMCDPTHKIVSTPAYMYGNAQPFEVFQGISKLVKEFLALA